MGKALTHVFALTKAQGGHTTEKHLCPRKHGQRLANDSMSEFDNRPDLAINALFKVQLEVNAENYLHGEHKRYGRSELGVYIIVAEFTAFVSMA